MGNISPGWIFAAFAAALLWPMHTWKGVSSFAVVVTVVSYLSWPGVTHPLVPGALMLTAVCVALWSHSLAWKAPWSVWEHQQHDYRAIVLGLCSAVTVVVAIAAHG
ncbi:hypothetical protein QR77_06655 [Streptomyces sp. 150FB]|uniref:hypothetical protein n=1 Tax=Streptomyces sp. 150FB TaxID=1576605 RepID=UPI000589678E|nr:hypothetical protein [Streptomyces sp. 150FB]KIF73752.1 hypothetical protein QR77_06655 [Streptomyces sp. 150FB]